MRIPSGGGRSRKTGQSVGENRPALQTLLESSLPGIKATDEPRRVACGTPGCIVTR
ncbi:MAG: hypothetical protein ACYCZ6_11455 [Polaromonas sp.]